MTEHLSAHGKWWVNSLFLLLLCAWLFLYLLSCFTSTQEGSFIYYSNSFPHPIRTEWAGGYVRLSCQLELKNGSFPKSPSFKSQKTLILKDYLSMLNNILKFTSLCNHPYLPKSLCAMAVLWPHSHEANIILLTLKQAKNNWEIILIWFSLHNFPM